MENLRIIEIHRAGVSIEKIKEKYKQGKINLGIPIEKLKNIDNINENKYDDNNLDQVHFNEKEKFEAKKNRFILCDKAGSGKATLLYALFGKELVLAKTGLSIYYYRIKKIL